MNTSKHTPGPWTIDGTKWINTPDSGGYRCVTVSGEDYDIANVMVDEGDETQEANAALVCAAPDLLTIAIAYRNLLKSMASSDGEVATFHHVSAIIAKATNQQPKHTT